MADGDKRMMGSAKRENTYLLQAYFIKVEAGRDEGL